MTTPPRWLLLEGGGSRTWCGLAEPAAILATATGPSTNPRSVGDAHAAETLTQLFTELLDTSGGTSPAGILAAHGAASTATAAARFAATLDTVATRIGVPGARVLVSNDITPLLLHGNDTAVCVVIAGTGTGFAARNGHNFARASGLEWLLADEGGGYDLARAGLRAAVRALDHRGPPTALTAAAHAWCRAPSGTPLPETLFGTVYDPTVNTKPHVAEFARHVLAAAESDDPVACALVDAAVGELVTGTDAVCRATGITRHSPLTLVLAGSLLTETDTMRRRLTANLNSRLQPTVVLDHCDTHHPQAMLTLLNTWTDHPARIAAVAAAIPTWPTPPAAESGSR